MAEMESTDGNDLAFGSFDRAMATAVYIEQLHNAEQNWLMNRLSWLFTSQAFVIAAYLTLFTTSLAPDVGRKVDVLRHGLPLFGIISCFFVAMAVRAAQVLMRDLANERARLCTYINRETGCEIPLIAGKAALRNPRHSFTLWFGESVHHLPWLLLFLWIGVWIA